MVIKMVYYVIAVHRLSLPSLDEEHDEKKWSTWIFSSETTTSWESMLFLDDETGTSSRVSRIFLELSFRENAELFDRLTRDGWMWLLVLLFMLWWDWWWWWGFTISRRCLGANLDADGNKMESPATSTSGARQENICGCLLFEHDFFIVLFKFSHQT